MEAFEPMDFTLLSPAGELPVIVTKIVDGNRLTYLFIISALGMIIIGLVLHNRELRKKQTRS